MCVACGWLLQWQRSNDESQAGWTAVRYELLRHEARYRSARVERQMAVAAGGDDAIGKDGGSVANEGSGSVDGDGDGHVAMDVDLASVSTLSPPVYAVMYEMFRRSTVPYRRICEMLEFEHCTYEMLLEVKGTFSATNMKSMEEHHSLPGFNKAGNAAKVRSAGTKKWDEDYGFSIDLVNTMSAYIENVLPPDLAEHLMCLSA